MIPEHLKEIAVWAYKDLMLGPDGISIRLGVPSFQLKKMFEELGILRVGKLYTKDVPKKYKMLEDMLKDRGLNINKYSNNMKSYYA